jgi:predicted nucleic acid-binding protein
MAKALPSLYMDSCCFIDMVAADMSVVLTDERAKKVWFYRQMIVAAIDGKLEVYTSQLTMNECTSVDGRYGEDVVEKFELMLNSSNGVIPVMPTQTIQAYARDLRRKHDINLQAMDSLHIASAIAVGAKEFITTDGESGTGSKKIISQAEKLFTLGIRAITSDKSDELPPEYKQLPLKI